MTEEKLIAEIKEKVEILWNVIKEAEKANLKVYVDLSTSTGRVRPEIKVFNILFRQG